jgi:type I restriction enzyme R subunit
MATVHREIRFEDAIEEHLLANDWQRGRVEDYDAIRALDTEQLFGFIAATQPKEWNRLIQLRGGNHQLGREKFLDRLTAEVEARGTFDVLRRGVEDLGVRIQLAYFRPAHRLAPEVQRLYDANRLTITRQLSYHPEAHEPLDLVLFINGLPVATSELKNPLTGQNIEDAVRQYREDRDPRAVLLSRRAVVHFAVDPDEVRMTTRLAARSTRFIPFNLGNVGGAGNPPNPLGYRTAYLWREVWDRHAWLDIFARFVQFEPLDPKNRQARRPVVFPRFHQWDAVRKLLAHAREHHAGQRYLVEHSAGSGKSNTIAWVAHQAASLHGDTDRKIFDKVIVISDRITIDSQLQDTVFQFEHKAGVVEKITEDSDQLATALTSETVQIIVTTLQKFTFVADKVAGLPARRYAVVVDEAHSSQSGEAAHHLKIALGAGASDADLLAAAEVEDEATAEERDPDEALLRSVEHRGPQPNLSYFAFTATPKHKTLELFGTLGPDGKKRSFHLYSMRQAIEEGFILDVLNSYATYKTYFRLAQKAAERDPEFERARAAAAIARYVILHRENLDQKAAIIVEHFREHTAAKIGGRAKAMVVCSSRLHAVRQKQAIDRYISQKSYDLSTLVAFSGTVHDGGLEHTESGINGFSEDRLRDEFARVIPEKGKLVYRILVVAEKYQTGYDQPLLHTLYIDRRLKGLQAVQTLSRVNRTHPDKEDTFILDFVNAAEEIQEAFKPYFEATITEPTDPNLLFNARDRIWDFRILVQTEIDAFTEALLAGGPGAHAKLYGHTDPARERFLKLSKDERTECRRALEAFIRLYAFLAHIVPFHDQILEKLYLFSKALVQRLPKTRVGALDLGDDVVLTHLRTQLKATSNISLVQGQPELPGFTGAGRGKVHEPEKARLSDIIQTLNERFGTDFKSDDELYFDQIREALSLDADLVAQAKANQLDNFRFGFEQAFESKVIERREANEEIFSRLMDDPEFMAAVKNLLVGEVYERILEREKR